MVERTYTIPQTEVKPEQIAGGFLVVDGISGIALNPTPFNGLMGIVRSLVGVWLIIK